MNKKIKVVLLFILLCVGTYVLYQNYWRFVCDEKKIVLEGNALSITDKYPTYILGTSEKDYWIYGFKAMQNADTLGRPLDYNEMINYTVKISGILSPELGQDTPAKCNVCLRTCPHCQCPNRELLYDVQILEVYYE